MSTPLALGRGSSTEQTPMSVLLACKAGEAFRARLVEFTHRCLVDWHKVDFIYAV